jgi:predicted alpha/beta hydrolase family esterase
MRYVIVPGIDGSDQDHWQSIWQAAWGESAVRIRPASWDRPDLDDWCQAIDRAAGPDPSEAVLVAHSLGCLAAADWAARSRRDIRGVFLVAPPDAAGPNFPAAAAPTFTAAHATPLDVPGLVISSDDDPYCTTDAAERLASGWHLDRVSVGRAGHINSASRLAHWDLGRALLTAFTAGTRARANLHEVVLRIPH